MSTDPSAPPPSPAPEQPVQLPRTRTSPAEAFSAAELRDSMRSPHRLLGVVLAERARLLASIAAANERGAALLVLGLCSLAATVPFGLVLAPTKVAHVAVLFSGSALICFPSLQVFGAYFGNRLTTVQNLALSLLAPAAAALFCFGFFPIQWFLAATMPSTSTLSAKDIAVGLLAVSLALGLGHLNRCIAVGDTLRELRSNWLLLLGWQALLVFITWRMAQALGILG